MTVQHHIIMGIGAAVLSLAHIFINRKYFFKSLRPQTFRKLNGKAKIQYTTSLSFTVVWTICIVTGFILAFANVADLFLLAMVHMFTAMLSLLLVVIHIAQHAKHIVAYFSKKHKTEIKTT